MSNKELSLEEIKQVLNEDQNQILEMYLANIYFGICFISFIKISIIINL